MAGGGKQLRCALPASAHSTPAAPAPTPPFPAVPRTCPQIQSKYGVRDVDVVRAQFAYRDDPEVKALMGRLKAMMLGDDGEGGEGGEPSPESVAVPEGMTADSFFELFSRHINTIERCFGSAVRDAKLAVPGGGPARRAYFEDLVKRRAGGWQAEAQAAVGLSEEDFQRCIFRWQSEQRFVLRILQSSKRQEELLATLDE